LHSGVVTFSSLFVIGALFEVSLNSILVLRYMLSQMGNCKKIMYVGVNFSWHLMVALSKTCMLMMMMGIFIQ
jgi:hypothetical protein